MTDHEHDAYHGTRGHSGGTTSEEAAASDLTKGITSAIQKYALIMAEQAGARGVTVAELREAKGGLHHGRTSSALTKHHISGRLVALREVRGNCGVYVLPEFVNGREARPYRRQKKAIDPEVIVGVLLSHEYLTPRDDMPYCRCREWVTPATGPTYPDFRAHLAEKIVEALS